MPNHVSNRITIHADEPRRREILEAVKADDVGAGSIDFNKLVPMPEELDIECGSRTDKGLKLFRQFVQECRAASLADLEAASGNQALLDKYTKLKDAEPDVWELGERAYNNIQNHGFPTWYEFRSVRWGSKWGAYDQEALDTGDTIQFHTAWNNVQPILTALSGRFPDAVFEYQWADEDIGSNVGWREFQAGRIVGENLPLTHTKEAYEMAAEMWGLDLEGEDADYSLTADGSNYIYLNDWEDFKRMTLLGRPALYHAEVLHMDEIPKGLHVYPLENYFNDNGYISVRAKPNEHCSECAILKEPLDFGGRDSIALSADTQPEFTGETDTIRDFLRGGPEPAQAMDMQMGGM